jgi:hypothetical protein
VLSENSYQINVLKWHENIIMSTFAFKKICSEESAFGLDSSSVKIEKFQWYFISLKTWV